MIGREEEIKYLRSLKSEEESQFIAIYGRRRIGKTYLIRESFGYEFTFQHTGVGNDEKKSAETQKQEQVNLYQRPDMTMEEDLIPGQRPLMGLKR